MLNYNNERKMSPHLQRPLPDRIHAGVKFEAKMNSVNNNGDEPIEAACSLLRYFSFGDN